MNDQTPDLGEAERAQGGAPQPPLWLRASLADLADLDVEAPIAQARNADCQDLSDLYRAAIETVGSDGARPGTPASRVFSTLYAATGMHFRSQERNEPFGAMTVMPDGRRSPALADFRGEPVAILAAMAERAKHPVLRAGLADVCWVLERKRGPLAAIAVTASPTSSKETLSARSIS